MDEHRLLLVEDDPTTAHEIETELDRLVYLVDVATTERAGLQAARLTDPALLIVDRTLAGADSLSMVESLRSEGIDAPILLVSAISSAEERIRGLKAGADDYLTKPFTIGELTARVEALLRRADRAAAVLRVGPLKLDLVARTLRRKESFLTRIIQHRLADMVQMADLA